MTAAHAEQLDATQTQGGVAHRDPALPSQARRKVLIPRHGDGAWPEFLLIGAQKCATTTVYAQLCAHPLVRPATEKELHFFDEPHWRDAALYRSQFPAPYHWPLDATARAEGLTPGDTITGEATPRYLCHPAAAARAAAVIPDARILVMVRDPVDRAVSAYHQACRHGLETRPAREALDPEAREPRSALDDVVTWDECRNPVLLRGYLWRGQYAEQLARWTQHFAPEQILVTDAAALRDHRIAATAYATMFDHLGIGQLAAPAPLGDQNVGEYPAPDPGVLRVLREYFAPHNAALFTQLGVHFEW